MPPTLFAIKKMILMMMTLAVAGAMNAVATINSGEGMTGRQLSVPHKH